MERIAKVLPTNGRASVLSLRHGIGWVCLAILLVFANAVIVNQVSKQTPDEIIAIRVIQHMHATSSLDTDWGHIKDFPDLFKRVHFNFSGYFVAADAFVSLAGTPLEQANLLNRLRLFSKICTMALLLVVFLTTGRLWGQGYALIATCAVLTAPVLFQDAHYARPEALGTLLFTFCMTLALCGPDGSKGNFVRLVLIAAISGFLSSIKVTYFLAAAFGLPVSIQCLRQYSGGHIWRYRITTISLFAATFIVAFILGIPQILREPLTYFSGQEFLIHHYGGAHPPHSLPDYHFLTQLGWIGSYFASTLGLTTFLLHALGYFNLGANQHKRLVILTYFTITVLTTLLFAHEHVFFERNLSHLVPGFLIISSGGFALLVRSFTSKLPSWKPAALSGAAITIALLVLWQYVPVQVSRHLHRTFSLRGTQADHRKFLEITAAIERRIGAVKATSIGYPQVFRGTLPPDAESCVLYVITTYGDPWSNRFISSLPTRFQIAGLIPSLFSGIPTSTLQTYQSATHYLIYDEKLCHAAH